jgi:hypothetical protein
MPRSRAEALLDGVVARAQEVNSDPEQMFWVDVVELFGSLTRADAATVGDVDLRVQFSHRYTGDAMVGEIERRWPGRSLLDAVVAATTELHRHLAGRSCKIELQLDETISRPLPDATEPVTVYTRQ